MFGDVLDDRDVADLNRIVERIAVSISKAQLAESDQPNHQRVGGYPNLNLSTRPF